MNELENKINDITELTQSEKDRLHFKERVNETLLTFLQEFVNQSIAKSDLEDKLDEDLLDILQNPTEENSLTNFEKIKLKEILSKEKTESKVGLLKTLIENSRSNDSNKKQQFGNDGNEHSKIGENTTQEDIDKAKNVLNKFDKILKFIEKTEFSEEEQKKSS